MCCDHTFGAVLLGGGYTMKAVKEYSREWVYVSNRKGNKKQQKENRDLYGRIDDKRGSTLNIVGIFAGGIFLTKNLVVSISRERTFTVGASPAWITSYITTCSP
jgi:hypothetical protein